LKVDLPALVDGSLLDLLLHLDDALATFEDVGCRAQVHVRTLDAVRDAAQEDVRSMNDTAWVALRSRSWPSRGSARTCSADGRGDD
jgi:hypothetical protein